jgi:hypothetical protein
MVFYIAQIVPSFVVLYLNRKMNLKKISLAIQFRYKSRNLTATEN